MSKSKPPLRFMHHQQWSDALFMHYPVDAEQLQRLLPAGLVVDTHEGTVRHRRHRPHRHFPAHSPSLPTRARLSATAASSPPLPLPQAYVGVVALSELGIAPAGVLAPRLLRPLLNLLRVSHHAVNVRTYVRPADGGPPGVYFFSLDCSHALASLGARLLFNLPYRLARMCRSKEESGHRSGQHRLSSARHGPSAVSAPALDVTWGAAAAAPPPRAAEAGSLAAFLCERYHLYASAGLLMRRLLGVTSLWRGTIAHAPWPLQVADASVRHSSMMQASRTYSPPVV